LVLASEQTTLPYRHHRLKKGEETIVKTFLDGAGTALHTFRYFARRPLEVVRRHLCTWLIFENDAPAAYGHLDPEGGTTWLGIAVQKTRQRRGLGLRMMRLLMDSARGMGVRTLELSVDTDNSAAIALYERCGFKLAEHTDHVARFTRDLSPAREAVISSLAFRGQSVEAMITTAQEAGFALEFSSGMPYRHDMERVFLAAPLRRFAHNYFPAPSAPFVLNLASAHEPTRLRSIDHCVRGIELSHAVRAPFFSAHAGFCVDPKPSELGRKIEQRAAIDRRARWSHFVASLREVLERTRNLPTGFLVENNVLAAFNRYADGTNPLLCVDAEELLSALNEVNDARLGLLFDTGHMKVSANTLGFDLLAATQRLLSHIRCVHHSDNHGEMDDNGSIDQNYWFLAFMQRTGHAVHVLEVTESSAEALKRMERLLFYDGS
jgi:sugar phosphate isomerase/epimerase/GNAT superfamily N-acetyltransferase